MQAPRFLASLERRRTHLLTGAFLLVFGLRLVVVSWCGVPVPYVDEWSAIGRDILLPFQDGTLTWPALSAIHNGEHCIMVTRLLEIALFTLNGQWDPIVGMALNAGLVAAMATVWIHAAMPAVDGSRSRVAASVLAVLWALPLGYANLLWAFQSQMTVLLLCTVLALRETSGVVNPGSPRGGLVTAVLVGAVLSSGGGFVTVAVTGMILLVRTGPGALTFTRAAGSLCGVALAGAVAMAMKAPSLSDSLWTDIVTTFAKGASWPGSNLLLLATGDGAVSRYIPAWMQVGGPSGWWGHGVGGLSQLLPWIFGVLGCLTWTPFLTRAFALCRQRRTPEAEEVFHFALGIWVLAIVAGIALKRSGDYFVPTRYIDLILPGLIVNGWFLWRKGGGGAAPNGDGRWLRPVWLTVVGGTLALTLIGVIAGQAPRKASEGRAWVRNVSDYLQHKDAARLANLNLGELPILGSDPSPLVEFLNLPGLAALLVPELRGELPHHGPLGSLIRWLLSASPLIASGGAILLANELRHGARKPAQH